MNKYVIYRYVRNTHSLGNLAPGMDFASSGRLLIISNPFFIYFVDVRYHVHTCGCATSLMTDF